MKLFDWIKRTIGIEEEEDDEFFLSGLKFPDDSENCKRGIVAEQLSRHIEANSELRIADVRCESAADCVVDVFVLKCKVSEIPHAVAEFLSA